MKSSLTETNSDIFKKNSYLAARLGGIKRKESSRGSVMNNTDLLFISPSLGASNIFKMAKKGKCSHDAVVCRQKAHWSTSGLHCRRRKNASLACRARVAHNLEGQGLQ